VARLKIPKHAIAFLKPPRRGFYLGSIIGHARDFCLLIGYSWRSSLAHTYSPLQRPSQGANSCCWPLRLVSPCPHPGFLPLPVRVPERSPGAAARGGRGGGAEAGKRRRARTSRISAGRGTGVVRSRNAFHFALPVSRRETQADSYCAGDCYRRVGGDLGRGGAMDRGEPYAPCKTIHISALARPITYRPRLWMVCVLKEAVREFGTRPLPTQSAVPWITTTPVVLCARDIVSTPSWVHSC